MGAIDGFLQDRATRTSASVPVFFELSRKRDQDNFEELIGEQGVRSVVDDYEQQQRELFALRNPSICYTAECGARADAYMSGLQKESPLWQQGQWVYFPWLSRIVHVLVEEEFHMVRTSRNRNLLTKDEQDRFYRASVGVGGLSVGSFVVLALVLQGGAKYLKLADMDRLSLSNTNRISGGVGSLGSLKAEMVARQVYEINPYAHIELFSQGITPSTVESFVMGERKLDVIIDEVDDLATKVLLREKAREYRLPLVMAADNGDSGVVDIERYDLDPQTPLFHGRISEPSYERFRSLDKWRTGQTIAGHIGVENHTERMLMSLCEMGKTIVSWPQLGGTAMLNGAAVAYCVRRIVNGQPLENNRVIVNLEEQFVPNYHSPDEQKKRRTVAETFKKRLGL